MMEDKDWLVESLEATKPILDSLPVAQKKAIELDAKYRTAVERIYGPQP